MRHQECQSGGDRLGKSAATDRNGRHSTRKLATCFSRHYPANPFTDPKSVVECSKKAKIPQIVAILTSVLPLGVEIQLRILQTLPSLFTRCSLHLHENLLADALLLCFRLQDSRIGVVSSTSAATLRQLVMVVFEGVAEEDQAVKTAISTDVALDPIRKETDFVVSIPAFEKLNDADQAETTEARRVILRPSAKDAYLVFEDLCLLVNGDSPSFLKLQSLPKTFGLELIESVMTGHSVLFQQVCATRVLTPSKTC